MTAAILGVLLVLAAGFLLGVEHERGRRPRTAPDRTTPTPAADTTLTDREWERFVVAIYDLADRDDNQQ